MARGVNSCTFIGNLGADPESKQGGNNTVVNVSLAVNEEWGTGDDRKSKVIGKTTKGISIIALNAWCEKCYSLIQPLSRITTSVRHPLLFPHLNRFHQHKTTCHFDYLTI